jgi:nickel transport protein
MKALKVPANLKKIYEKTMRAQVFLFSLVVVFFTPVFVCAHGVESHVENGGLVVAVRYTTGEAMSYARVSIAAPGAELSFQSGRTDRNGRFCFFPDTSGEWKVVVDDEMGHRIQVNVPVDEAMTLDTGSAAERQKGSLSKYERVLIGIGIIFGTSGFFFWCLGIRSRRKVSRGFRGKTPRPFC